MDCVVPNVTESSLNLKEIRESFIDELLDDSVPQPTAVKVQKAPIRSMNSFHIFLNINRHRLMKEKGIETVKEANSLLKNVWKQMSEEEKSVFINN